MGRVAQLDHRADRQVDPLVSRRHATQLGALVDRRVPGSLHLHLDHIRKKKDGKSTAKRVPLSTLSGWYICDLQKKIERQDVREEKSIVTSPLDRSV